MSNGESLLLLRLRPACRPRSFPQLQLRNRSPQYPSSHSGKVIVTASSQYVIIISLKTGEVERHLFREGKNVPVRCIRLSAHRVYAGFEDGEIAVWDLDSFELQSTLDLHKSSVAWIALSEDETRLISGGLDGHIFLWDLLAEEQQQM